jgi:hypothetical protein
MGVLVPEKVQPRIFVAHHNTFPSEYSSATRWLRT